MPWGWGEGYGRVGALLEKPHKHGESNRRAALLAPPTETERKPGTDRFRPRTAHLLAAFTAQLERLLGFLFVRCPLARLGIVAPEQSESLPAAQQPPQAAGERHPEPGLPSGALLRAGRTDGTERPGRA